MYKRQTYDDLTKETVAEYFHKKMALDEESLKSITDFFDRLKRPMTENNKKQAMMPVGAKIFHNDNGTAPGLAISENDKTAVLLPGPPAEMRPMFRHAVIPYPVSYTHLDVYKRQQHSQDWSSLCAHVPGLKIVFPVTPYDAKGLLNSALSGTDPVIYLESQSLYGMGELFHEGGVPEGYYAVSYTHLAGYLASS